MGIQARFGIDSYAGDQDMTATAEAAVGLVESYVDAWDSQDFTACAGCCNFPLIQADPGEVQRWQDADAFAEALSASPWRSITARAVRATQAGAHAVNVALEATLGDGERREQAVSLLTHHDGRRDIRGGRSSRCDGRTHVPVHRRRTQLAHRGVRSRAPMCRWHYEVGAGKAQGESGLEAASPYAGRSASRSA
jgi:hypothetical protein